MKSKKHIKFIAIPKSTDRSYGYLSNDSPHAFKDQNGLFWPTVTHYIEAKKFEGTQYEEDIRKSKTVLQARNKTRGRNSVIVKLNENDETYDINLYKIYDKKHLGFSYDKD